MEGVHLIGPNQQASDLACAAVRKVLAGSGTSVEEIDLLLFAATTPDMLEPATSRIVAAKLGLACPVFDIRNACNSVLNAMEATTALIATGGYRTVLIACGEASSLSADLAVTDAAAFARALPSYGFSDAGAALILRSGRDGPDAPGALASRFLADSSTWDAAR